VDSDRLAAVHAKVAAKIGDVPCAACGARSSFVPDPAYVGFMMVQFDPNASEGDAPASQEGIDTTGMDIVRMDAVGFICGNCGFVRTHAVLPDSLHGTTPVE